MIKRYTTLLVVFLMPALSRVECGNPPKSAVDYTGFSKQQLLRRLGLPAEIQLLPSKETSSTEVWTYYWDEPKRGIQPGEFYFCGPTVCIYRMSFDPARIISIQTRSGLERVRRYISKDYWRYR